MRIFSAKVPTTSAGINVNAVTATTYRIFDVALDVIMIHDRIPTATAVPCQQKFSSVHPRATISSRDDQRIAAISNPPKIIQT
jgi:hypothetical protein